jgi:photosystem II stability/assembly factor-like uncharacterized protein
VTGRVGGKWWAVGERGKILASNDGGLTWSRQFSPRNEDLYAVAFADGMKGMTVGAHGVVLVTHNGGINWVDNVDRS